MQNCTYCVKLIDYVKQNETDSYNLIYSSSYARDMKKVVFGISPNDLKYYMYQILKCLEYTHSQGIMHRDIKTGNIVVNIHTKTVTVIDWGLAEYYIRNHRYNLKVASLYYKAPELLLKYRTYDYAIDLWGLGCLFAGALFQKDHFFKGKDVDDQIYKIAEVLGGKGVFDFVKKYNTKVKFANKRRLKK